MTEPKALRMTMEVGSMKGDGPINEKVFVAEEAEINLFFNGWSPGEPIDEQNIQHAIRTAVQALFDLKRKEKEA